jgi:putative membrane-bound dehydrogenase-like protein
MRSLLLLACVCLAALPFALLSSPAAPHQVPPAAERLPRIPPKEPAEALKTFQTLDGFRMDLLASEPLVTSPVAMAYDENGLAYVVEMYDYPYTDKATHQPWKDNTTDLPLGRVRVLEDTDGDGVFDKATVFADKLSWPTGIALWKGGVFVAATPDIWYFKDTDGDRKADVRRKVYTGSRKYNVQAVMNNLVWGLDHHVYGAGGTNGGRIRHVNRPDARPVDLARKDFRFDPVTEALEALSGGERFGNTFDDWGNRFICNIRNPVIHVVLPNHYLARNPFLPVRSAVHDAAPSGDTLPVYRISPPEPWRVARSRRWSADPSVHVPRSELNESSVTSTSGLTVYRGAAYPSKYYGNVFLGEVAGNLIHRQTLTPDGVTFKAERADPNTEFVRSTDNWFRPVNFVNAPDGTLHVLDMYRETIEHPWSIPDDIHAQLDLLSGRDRGRIYRLAPRGFQAPPPPRLGRAGTAELVATLENPNAWWRETAHRLLFERQDPAAVEPLRRLLRTSSRPVARLAALWSLAGLDALREEDLLRALGDEAAGVREHGVRLAEARLAQSPRLFDRVLALAQDPDERVRFQVAFTLGEVKDPRAAVALTALARRDAADPWVRAAVLSSAAESCDRLLVGLLDEQPSPGPELTRQLAAVVGARDRPPEVNRVLAAVAEKSAGRASVVAGLGDGLKRTGKSLRKAVAGSPAAKAVLDVLTEAQQVARDETRPAAERQQAVQLLGYDDLDQVRATLVTLLDARQPHEVQLAAVRTLGSFPGPDVARLLLEPWRGYTPAVRGEAVEALLARKERIGPLLDAVQARLVAVGDVPPGRRTLLLRHADPAVRDRAASLFGGAGLGARKEVIAKYRPALRLAGDRERGVKVFQRECSSCHRLGDQGHEVGPNLNTVQHRTAEEVLVHVLDPNLEVAPEFIEYLVVLKDGRTTTGVIAAETATGITLRRANDVQETILRQAIEEITSTGKSLMPEGLEQKLSLQDMADLLKLLVRLP